MTGEFQAGQRVLVNGRGPNDRSQTGRTGTFIEYVRTGTGSMARVNLDEKSGLRDEFEDKWILHPESLAPLRCPTCDSPKKELHPAMQFEGEVELCKDAWHQAIVAA